MGYVEKKKVSLKKQVRYEAVEREKGKEKRVENWPRRAKRVEVQAAANSQASRGNIQRGRLSLIDSYDDFVETGNLRSISTSLPRSDWSEALLLRVSLLRSSTNRGTAPSAR